MAATYGRVNVISSFGFCVRWRHQAAAGLPLTGAGCVVDLMCGMGELWGLFAKGLPASARVIGVDLSVEMTRRAVRQWPFPVDVHVLDVFEWDAPEALADVVVSSFGLKTFDRDQQKRLAQVVARLLKPGGTCSFIEVSVPRTGPLRALYMFYLKRVIPIIGKVLLGDPECYRMLGVYTEAFGDASYFAQCLRECGIDAILKPHFFGCATGVRGRKFAAKK
jgi:demethylmenaquinone methyltransferase/2-methoxy-6-polyprenyl-1,4-benzoquinol methylase